MVQQVLFSRSTVSTSTPTLQRSVADCFSNRNARSPIAVPFEYHEKRKEVKSDEDKRIGDKGESD